MFDMVKAERFCHIHTGVEDSCVTRVKGLSPLRGVGQRPALFIKAELKNTMTRHRINKEDIVGDTTEPPEDYDLMELIIIRRGEDASEDQIFQYLDAIFKSDIIKMKKHSTVEWPEETEREVRDMYGFGEALVKETKDQMNKKIVSNLILENEPIEKIARVVDIPVEKVTEIVAELKKNELCGILSHK